MDCFAGCVILVLGFGWRQTGAVTKLQLEVNQGAIGIIAARRKNDALSGHIVAVISEFDAYTARRNAAGEVMAPLQSRQEERTSVTHAEE